MTTTNATPPRSTMRFTAKYRNNPWGTVGMEVRLYRSIKGNERWPTRYSLRTAEGPIASSGDILDLIDLADQEHWIVNCATEQVYNAYAEAALS